MDSVDNSAREECHFDFVCHFVEDNYVIEPYVTGGSDVKIFYCPYRESGCKEGPFISLEAHDEHDAECEYRDVDCYRQMLNCRPSRSMRSYPCHWKRSHEILLPGEDGGYVITHKFRSVFNDVDELEPHLVEYDGEHFMIHAAAGEDYVYWWSMILGDTSDAENYYYDTKVIIPDEVMVPGILQNTMSTLRMVLPFHKYKEFDALKSGLYSNIGAASVAIYCKTNPEKEYPFEFRTWIKFFKMPGDTIVKNDKLRDHDHLPNKTSRTAIEVIDLTNDSEEESDLPSHSSLHAIGGPILGKNVEHIESRSSTISTLSPNPNSSSSIMSTMPPDGSTSSTPDHESVPLVVKNQFFKLENQEEEGVDPSDIIINTVPLEDKSSPLTSPSWVIIDLISDSDSDSLSSRSSSPEKKRRDDHDDKDADPGDKTTRSKKMYGRKKSSVLSPIATPEPQSPEENLLTNSLTLTPQLEHEATVSIIPVQCIRCKAKKFDSKEELIRHTKTEHDRQQRHNCPFCIRYFKVGSSVKYHLRTTHEFTDKNLPVRCSWCEKRFKNKSSLKKHSIIHKNNRTPFVCNIKGCKKAYNKMTALHNHRRWHDYSCKNKAFRCQKCPRVFEHENSRYNHMKREHGPRFKCYFCEEEKKSFRELNFHVSRYHTREDIFKCDDCGYLSTNYCDLFYHKKWVHVQPNLQRRQHQRRRK